MYARALITYAIFTPTMFVNTFTNCRNTETKKKKRRDVRPIKGKGYKRKQNVRVQRNEEEFLRRAKRNKQRL